jgi:RecA-family ATPase
MDELDKELAKETMELPPLDFMPKPVDDNTPVPEALQSISYDDLIKKDMPEVRWLIKDVLPINSLIILAAPTYHYKTWILLEFARAIAGKQSLFNKFEVPEKKGVVIVNEEMWEGTIQSRVLALPHQEADLPILFYNQQTVKIDNEEHTKALIKACKDVDAGIIIFDSFVRIHNLDENSASDMRKAFEFLTMFTKEGIATLVTHHHRKPPVQYGASKAKDDINSMRGSSDIAAMADCVWGVKKTDQEGSFVLMNFKQRMQEPVKPFKVSIRKEDDVLLFNYEGEYGEDDEKSNKIMESMDTILTFVEQNPNCSTSEVVESMTALKIGRDTIKKALKKLEEDKMVMVKAGKGKTGRPCNLYSRYSENDDIVEDISRMF